MHKNISLGHNQLTLILIVIISKILLIAGQNKFVPLETGNSCFPTTTGDPRCSFSITSSSKNKIKTECLNNGGSVPALRVVGEFNILRIVCSASFAIDSLYYGIQVLGFLEFII